MIGLPFLRRRKSSLIDGAAADAVELTDHLATYLATLATDRSRPSMPPGPVVGRRAS